MDTIASLIRQFPEGSLFIILALIVATATVAKAIVNRNKPACDCECCHEDDDDDDDDDDHVIMGGEEEDVD